MSNHCDGCSGEKNYEKLLSIIDKYRKLDGALIPILHEAQEYYGYLPLDVQEVISKEINVPLADIYGVVTFYSQFSTEPKGKYVFSLCMGTACYVKGADKILEKLKKNLNISEGETTEDGLFTLAATRCIGACGLAPVMTVNSDVHGRLAPEDIEGIINQYKEKEA